MKKVAILLSILLLAPVLFIPGAVTATDENVFCPTGYHLLSSNMDGPNFVSRLQVQFTNFGPDDAYNVTAAISNKPDNVTVVPPGEVTLGYIPVGGSAWSSDYYELSVNMFQSSGTEEGITWTVTYYVNGDPDPQEIDVPQSCYGGSGAIPLGSDGEIAQPELWAVEYRYGAPLPGFSFAKWPLFESWMQVRIENRGLGRAFNVHVEVMNWPGNTEVPDPDVAVGYIDASDSAWSVDTFKVIVNMAKPVNNGRISWRISYEDCVGVYHEIENVPQFAP